MKYYDIIRNRRNELGITQEDMAKKLGYTDRSSIAKIESGGVDISYSKIIAIANILGLDPVSFFEFDDKEDEEVVTLFNRLPSSQKEAFLNLLRSTAEDRG